MTQPGRPLDGLNFGPLTYMLVLVFLCTQSAPLHYLVGMCGRERGYFYVRATDMAQRGYAGGPMPCSPLDLQC